MLIARRLYGDDTAILTGAILATSFSFVFFSRTAAADIENVAGILAVLWVFLRNEHRPPGVWTLVLWLLMALTSLTKGLLGFVVPIMIVGVYATFAAPGWRVAMLIERNRWLFNRMTLTALPLAVCVYLGPFLLSMACGGSADGLAMVYRENLQRFFDPVNHRGPIYLYVGAIFVLMAPWSLLLPAAFWPAGTVSNEARRGRVFALAYFWGTFAFFTLSASRRSYYLLPILPAGAFLIARLLTQREPVARGVQVLLRTGFFLLATAVGVSALALAPLHGFLPEPWDHLPGLPGPIAFAIAWLIAAACIILTFVRLEPGRIAWSFGINAAAFMMYLYVFALPAIEIHRTQKPFADAVRAEIAGNADAGSLPPGELANRKPKVHKSHIGNGLREVADLPTGGSWAGVAFYRTREIVFYLDAPMPLREMQKPEELGQAIAEGRIRWLIVRRRDWDSLKLAGTVRVAETIQPWEGAGPAETKLVLVEVEAVQSAVNK